MAEKIWPMLAKTATRASLDKLSKKTGRSVWEGYVLEAKHDGMRALVHKDHDGNVVVYSRSGEIYTDHVPHLIEQFQFLPGGTVLDGELAFVESFVEIHGCRIPKVNFNKTMRVMGSLPERARKLQREIIGPLSYIVFDVIKWSGHDLTGTKWTVRRARLMDAARAMIGQASDVDETPRVLWNPAFYDVTKFGEIYDSLVTNGLEGAIMKNVEGLYLPGKRPNLNWYKIKHEKTADVVVMGFTEARHGKTGKWDGLIGAIKFGAYDSEGNLKYVGRCSGMTDEERKFWTEIRDSGEYQATYVIEVKYNDMVGSGTYRTPRHPQYVRLRTDKQPGECSMEQFKSEAQ